MRPESVGSYFVGGFYESELFHGRYQDPNVPTETTWEQVFDRVALAVADGNDKDYERFLRMMQSGEALPSSPQLWNFGSTRPSNRQGSSCFTCNLGDTLVDFERADSHARAIYVSSGGAGFMGNSVRPRGCKIGYSRSGSVGVLGEGGPFRRLEATTGYITNGGRERGALMLQLSAWHPDAIEFCLAKKPIPLGFLDDWVANAPVIVGCALNSQLQTLILQYGAMYVFQDHWPKRDVLEAKFGESLVREATNAEILKEDKLGRMVPQVFDWNTGRFREANRAWRMPLQNCNMSLRVPDSLIQAAEEGKPWVLSWFCQESPKAGTESWTMADVDGTLQEYSGVHFDVSRDGTQAKRIGTAYDDVPPGVHQKERFAPMDQDYRYAVIITTWAGLKQNLKPNPKNFKDAEYARHYTNVILPSLEKYGDGTIMAEDVLDLIMTCAWGWADPGVVFEDIYERFNPVPAVARLSNPCSEFVNGPDGSCNLISPNVRIAAAFAALIEHPDENASASFDFVSTQSGFDQYLEEVGNTAADAFHYIARAMEYTIAPVESIDEKSRNYYRTVGVGLMGLAEAMMLFHIEYGTRDSARFAAATQSEIALTCWEGSFELARNGSPKPEGWTAWRMVEIFQARALAAIEYGLSNSQVARWVELADRARRGEYATHTAVTSVAPTGSISQIAQWQMRRNFRNDLAWQTSQAPETFTIREICVTSGGEPPYSWEGFRQDNNGSTTFEHDLWATAEHRNKPWMVTAAGYGKTVTPDGHITVQGALTAFCCMSVSKTINLPEDATVEDVTGAYLGAWKLGIPGTSLYRDHSRPMQVLTALDCPGGDCKIDDPKGKTHDHSAYENAVKA